MTQFTLLEIQKWFVPLLHIRHRISDTKISECLGVNLGKKSDESNGDYEDTATQKCHSDSFDKRPEFVGEIQNMIDNAPCESIRSIARYMGVSEFLTKQIVHEEVQYFP